MFIGEFLVEREGEMSNDNILLVLNCAIFLFYFCLFFVYPLP